MVTSPQARRPFDSTLDDSSGNLTLQLVTPARPFPVVDRRGLVGRRAEERSRVPRLSMLVQFEREHDERLGHVKRRYAFALVAVFAIGVAAGLAAQSPTLVRHVVDSSHAAARLTHAIVR